MTRELTPEEYRMKRCLICQYFTCTIIQRSKKERGVDRAYYECPIYCTANRCRKEKP